MSPRLFSEAGIEQALSFLAVSTIAIARSTSSFDFSMSPASSRRFASVPRLRNIPQVLRPQLLLEHLIGLTRVRVRLRPLAETQYRMARRDRTTASNGSSGPTVASSTVSARWSSRSARALSRRSSALAARSNTSTITNGEFGPCADSPRASARSNCTRASSSLPASSRRAALTSSVRASCTARSASVASRRSTTRIANPPEPIAPAAGRTTSVYVPADVERDLDVLAAGRRELVVEVADRRAARVADLHGEVDATLIDSHAQVLVGVEHERMDVRLAARERAFHRLHPRRRRVLANRGRTRRKPGQ